MIECVAVFVHRIILFLIDALLSMHLVCTPLTFPFIHILHSSLVEARDY
jgi:hypothetical protein